MFLYPCSKHCISHYMKYSMSGYPASLFVKPVSDSLLCCICLEVLNNPQQCKNGHMCCEECLRLTVLAKNESPTCKCGVDEERISCNRYVKGVVDMLEVKCSDNCNWTGALSEREKHILTECASDEAMCILSLTNSCRICKGTVSRSQYAAHLEQNLLTSDSKMKFGKAQIQYDHIYGYFMRSVSLIFEDGDLLIAQPISKTSDTVGVTVETRLLMPQIRDFTDYLVLRILKGGTYYESVTPYYGTSNREMLSLEMYSYFGLYKAFHMHKVYGSCRNFVVQNRTKNGAVFVLLAQDVSRFQFAYDSTLLTRVEVGKILHYIVTTVDDSDVSDTMVYMGKVALFLLVIGLGAAYVFFKYLI